MDEDTYTLLLAAHCTSGTVRITVTECLYGCCHRPPSLRVGYEQVYQGLVAELDERWLILHSPGLRQLNYHVVAALDHVQEAMLV